MASPSPTSKTSLDVSSEDIRWTLSRVLESKYFVHAPKKQKFIQLICDYYLQGRATELNEYLIGCEVFEKGAGYNPSVDPVVRVGAHDVRKKLELYYQNEGAADAVRLTVPVGTYVPIFIKRTESVQPQQEEAPVAITDSISLPVASPQVSPSQSKRSSFTRLLAFVSATVHSGVEDKVARSLGRLLLVACLIIFILSGVIIWLLFQPRVSAQPAFADEVLSVSDQAAYKAVWGTFLNNSNSTLLILSNPIVYRPVNAADPEALTKQGIPLAAEQTNLIENLSNSRLPLLPNQVMKLVPAINMFTGLGEAIGAYRLRGLLQRLGENSTLKQSRIVGPGDLKDNNVILLGSVYANQWSRPLSIKENFVYSSRATIENVAPQPGEEREYKSSFDQRTGTLLEDYALITVVPGVSGTNTVMSLSGIYSEGTQAAAEFVTDKEHISELNRRLQQLKGGPPRYYQALLKVRVENAFPTQIILVTVREL